MLSHLTFLETLTNQNFVSLLQTCNIVNIGKRTPCKSSDFFYESSSLTSFSNETIFLCVVDEFSNMLQIDTCILQPNQITLADYI